MPVRIEAQGVLLNLFVYVQIAVQSLFEPLEPTFHGTGVDFSRAQVPPYTIKKQCTDGAFSGMIAVPPDAAGSTHADAARCRNLFNISGM